MSKSRNPKFDEYISSSADFAKPILTHLRKLIHSASPDIEETIKWGMPHFEYKGVICSMAAFKEHCAFGFWKEGLIPGMKQYIKKAEAMGSWGRIQSLEGLPPDEDIIKFIRTAIELNEKGIKVEKEKRTKPELKAPDYFLKALKANKKALKTYENFSPGNKREYIEWILEAKTEKTREERLKTAVDWISKGKVRLWKYIKK